ncbi:hypothetical protein [Bacillus sp. FSL K6-3431]|uniref:hypothetical protein n=1 Tax=Bacillus sp. FSL K6-3431 TaxID=2921500 RepID=UPI0030F6F86F
MMPDKKRDLGANSDPHFDGKQEGIINDSIGTASSKMGIRIDMNKTNNPFHLTKTNNEDMKEFEQLTRGKTVSD